MKATSARLAALSIGLALAFTFTGCTADTPSAQPQPSQEAPMPQAPVPVLKVGDSFAVDLIGDGQATVIVTEARVNPVPGAASPPGTVPFVVTVAMALDKAGKPITGGPRNFRFRDATAAYHAARTSKDAFAPELASMNFTTAGQRTEGNVIFDVAPDLVSGGEIQLVSGRMILAVWKV